MKTQSVVEFETASRIHVGLAVRSLDESVQFYRSLFGQEPSKSRPRYAKFEVAEPPLNLTLNEAPDFDAASQQVTHFGIQVKSTRAVTQATQRFHAHGLETREEDGVTCCYAVQDKTWVTDPDGNAWEVFVVLDNDSAEYQPQANSACCATGPESKSACC